MSIEPEDPDFVNALARGLDVIKSFGQKAELLTLAQTAARVGLSRGTTRRLLMTLEALGYVRQEGRGFRLTPRILDLGYSYLSSMPIWKAAQPILKEVVDTIDQSCSLGVLDGHDIVYIARTPPSHLAYLPVSPGTRMPAHVNAMGVVLLSCLGPDELQGYFANARLEQITKYTRTDEAEIRKALIRAAHDQYAISDRQMHIGIRSIAVPVPSRSGRPEVAINISADVSRATKSDMINQFLPVLRRAAEQLSFAF